MLVQKEMLNCAGFIAEVLSEDLDAESVDPIGTGVFISIPSARVQNYRFYYFVTARHVIDSLNNRASRIVVNTKTGGVVSLNIPRFKDRPNAPPIWVSHPDPSVDISATPFHLKADYEIVSIPKDIFATPELMREKKIGIGDETYTIGLFTPAPGSQRNQPILRIGNIAMLPEGPIQVEGRMCEVFLIEARSLGGLSGSPVFVHRTFSANGAFHQHSYFLGVMHGHWDIRESEINSPTFIQDRQRGVNLGISIVVPAHKILELLDHPDLSVPRGWIEQDMLKRISPQPDKAVE